MTTNRVSYIVGKKSQSIGLDSLATELATQLSEPQWELLRDSAAPLFLGIGASYCALALPVGRLRSHNIPAMRELASEIADTDLLTGNDLVLAVSQSGKSTETLDTIGRLDSRRCAALVNASGSPLETLTPLVLSLGDLVDSYASTIAYTGTLIGLDAIADAILGVPAQETVRKWESIGELISQQQNTALEGLSAIAPRLASTTSVDFVGAGAQRVASEGGALLIREVARIPASHSSTRNYLHGEMESASATTLHVVLGDSRELELAQTLSESGHLTVLVSSSEVRSTTPNLVVIPVSGEDVSRRAVLETVVVQELAALAAAARDVEIEEFVFANHDTKHGGIAVEGVPDAH